MRELREALTAVYVEFLAPGAPEPINVDSRIADSVRRKLQAIPALPKPLSAVDRFVFDEAEVLNPTFFLLVKLIGLI